MEDIFLPLFSCQYDPHMISLRRSRSRRSGEIVADDMRLARGSAVERHGLIEQIGTACGFELAEEL